MPKTTRTNQYFIVPAVCLVLLCSAAYLFSIMENLNTVSTTENGMYLIIKVFLIVSMPFLATVRNVLVAVPVLSSASSILVFNCLKPLTALLQPVKRGAAHPYQSKFQVSSKFNVGLSLVLRPFNSISMV